MQKTPPYIIINWVFFVLLLIGFFYSWIFYPDSLPFDCMVKAQTGRDCPSCGFSRAFSYFMHGNFENGLMANTHAFPVFLFFILQLAIRSAVIFYFHATRHLIAPLLIKLDCIISISLFLLAFLPILTL